MVLGIRSKSKKSTSIPIDYIVHIHEIKPWPPSQSLKSLRAVVLQWENADRNSGFTDPVTPSIEDARIEFNKLFDLHVTMYKEVSDKKNADAGGGAFHKNILDLNLYEPRNNRSVKGQLIGSAAIDLAELGVLKETVNVSVPVSCKRSYRNTSQPVLYLSLRPLEKEGSGSGSGSRSVSSSSKGSKEASMERDERESVSALMTEEYAEEAEIASFTDDDVTEADVHSSPGNSTSSFHTNASSSNGGADDQLHIKNVTEIVEAKKVEGPASIIDLPVDKTADLKHVTEPHDTEDINSHQNENSSLLLQENSPDSQSLSNGSLSLLASVKSHDHESSEKEERPPIDPALSLTVDFALSDSGVCSSGQAIKCHDSDGILLNASSNEKDHLVQVEESFQDCNSHDIENFHHPVDIQAVSQKEPSGSTLPVNNQENGFCEGDRVIHMAAEEESIKEIQNHPVEIKFPSASHPTSLNIPNAEQPSTPPKQNVPTKPLSDASTFSRRSRTLGGRSGFSSNGSSNELENMQSVRFPAVHNHFKEDATEIDILEDASAVAGPVMMASGACEHKYSSVSSGMKPDPEVDTMLSDKKIRQLELRVEMLEAELRDIAAIEVGLYSVVAEHGGSTQKVHAPARRLSRLYSHALENWSAARSSTTARTIVSGLVLAAKACGNDVPRLTFWLSNLVVLRAVAAHGIERLNTTISAKGLVNGSLANGDLTTPDLKPFSLKWKPSKGETDSFNVVSDICNWQEPKTFLDSLEKVESWIFSRIIKSLWWQTLTPYMQTSNVEKQKSFHKNSGRLTGSSSFQRTDSSIDHWKKAFKEARERLCPVRAAGLECGCLASVSQLVMEQCVTRLDVAIFNAILRISDDEIPTDPVSDPISDLNVIPIPAGKLTFGAGAQLKNVIGNWSRWLTDLFGIDDEQLEDVDGTDVGAPHKSFCLLNALSDLLMLPKDFLSERSIRKEICPTFSGLIIKRILSSFVTDEFCPDSIPDNVFQALDDEDEDGSSEAIQDLPCSAPPITYNPPLPASVARQIGLTTSTASRSVQRSDSHVLRKCYTSDDELEELEFPLDSLVLDKSCSPSTNLREKKGPSAVRYQLLREVWMENQ